jgi:competence protein ComEA
MKKVILALLLCASWLFGAIDVQTATKSELMSIKGIGAKKADSIIEYRKTNKLSSVDDLKNVKGIGKGIVNNVKNDIKSGDKKAKKDIESKKEKQEKKTVQK